MKRMMLCLLLCWFTLPGCDAVGVMAQAVSPPELVEAAYRMPDKPTLILIDDPRGLVSDDMVLRRLARTARVALEAEKVISTGFVGQDKLAAYREQLGPAYPQTSLAALALHLEAKQVIHAEVTGYQMEIGPNVVRPSIAMDVKVFDLDQAVRVFPSMTDAKTGADTGQTTYPLTSKRPAQDLTGIGAARSIASRELADQAGRDLGRLFFDWRKPKPGSTMQR